MVAAVLSIWIKKTTTKNIVSINVDDCFWTRISKNSEKQRNGCVLFYRPWFLPLFIRESDRKILKMKIMLFRYVQCTLYMIPAGHVDFDKWSIPGDKSSARWKTNKRFSIGRVVKSYSYSISYVCCIRNNLFCLFYSADKTNSSSLPPSFFSWLINNE